MASSTSLPSTSAHQPSTTMPSAPAPSPSLRVPALTSSVGGRSSSEVDGSASLPDLIASVSLSPKSVDSLTFDPTPKEATEEYVEVENDEDEQYEEIDLAKEKRRYSAMMREYTKSKCQIALDNFHRANKLVQKLD